MKKYRFFWKDYLSNRRKSPITDNGIKYVNVEQYMMYSKAKLMEDFDTAQQIMETEDPSIHKYLGRCVNNFNPEIWEKNKYNIVKRGIQLKFNQNQKLLEKLMNEDADLFVEASPYDLIWGIGLDEESAKNTSEENWPGQNLLGKIITEVRNEKKKLIYENNKTARKIPGAFI